MPRGSNTSAEVNRIRSGEMADGRGTARTGTGTVPHERPGYGNGSMQKNPKTMKKPSF